MGNKKEEIANLVSQLETAIREYEKEAGMQLTNIIIHSDQRFGDERPYLIALQLEFTSREIILAQKMERF